MALVQPGKIFLFSGDDIISLQSACRKSRTHKVRSRLFGPDGLFVKNNQLGGHPGVRENLKTGLDLIGQSYYLNRMPADDANSAGVLAGRRIARDLLNKESSIILGPNYVVSPREDPQVVLSEKVELVVPSEWTRQFYVSEMPQLNGRVHVWASGVDHRFWSPSELPKPHNIALIYAKKASGQQISDVQLAIEACGVRSVIVRYGSYTPEQYRSWLRKCRFIVFLGESESQGLAHFEAWSVGVPTFVKQGQHSIFVNGPGSSFVVEPGMWSASPYLSGENGAFWNTLPELKSLACSSLANAQAFRPREFILRTHTLEHSAANYVDIYHKGAQI